MALRFNRSLGRGPIQRFLNPRDHSPTWSPTGKRLAFVRQRLSTDHSAIFTVRLDGTRAASGHALAVGRWPARLVAQRPMDRVLRTDVVGYPPRVARSSERTRAPHHHVRAAHGGLSFSPNGRRITASHSPGFGPSGKCRRLHDEGGWDRCAGRHQFGHVRECARLGASSQLIDTGTFDRRARGALGDALPRWRDPGRGNAIPHRAWLVRDICGDRAETDNPFPLVVPTGLNPCLHLEKGSTNSLSLPVPYCGVRSRW